ncbi:MAG: type II toxin-antitoxin system RelE/ParE family toxin [Magnetococcales bacterium]|nr:type II toxin-antitoxin system RelE/ParE family toxin [Magnetococcales bacterium]
MSYSVVITPQAQRQIRKMVQSVQERVLLAIRQLEATPGPEGCIKMVGIRDLYRIRTGDYRIFYRIQDQKLLVLVLEVGNRREIYR